MEAGTLEGDPYWIDQASYFAAALLTLCNWIIRHFLHDFKRMVALCALITVRRHDITSSLITWMLLYKNYIKK